MKPEKIPEQIDLKAMAAAPLADALNINLPLGRRVMKRGPRHAYHDGIDAPRITQAQVADRRAENYSRKLCAVLDYYAASTVPIERVAEHVNMTIEDATAAMQRRGRTL